jgi:hypothetical protein
MSAGKNDPSVPDDLLFDELFTNGKLEQSTLFIDCNGDRAVLAPSCKEVFSSDGLVFEVTFGKEHLSEWSSIQTAIISLMRRFAANSKQ